MTQQLSLPGLSENQTDECSYGPEGPVAPGSSPAAAGPDSSSSPSRPDGTETLRARHIKEVEAARSHAAGRTIEPSKPFFPGDEERGRGVGPGTFDPTRRLVLYRATLHWQDDPTEDITSWTFVPRIVAVDPAACWEVVEHEIQRMTSLDKTKHGPDFELKYLYRQMSAGGREAGPDDCLRPNVGPVAAPVRYCHRANTLRCMVWRRDPAYSAVDLDGPNQLPMTGVAGGESYD